MSTVSAAAFALASLLALLALVTLGLKTVLERRGGAPRSASSRTGPRGRCSAAPHRADQIRGVSKTFGSQLILDRSISTSRPANFWRCSDLPAPARPRCCA